MSDANGKSHDERLEEILDEAATIERSRPEPDAEAFLARLRPHLQSAPATGRSWWRVAALIPVAGAIVWIVLQMAGSSTLDPHDADPAPEGVAVIEELDLLEELDRLLSPEQAGAIDLETVQVLEDWELLEELDGIPDEFLEGSG